MGKTMHDTTGSNSVYYNNGVFIDKCTIASIEDKSNYPTRKDLPTKTLGQNDFKPELCLLVKTEDGRTFTVFGQFDYAKDQISGKEIYKGWKKKGNAVQSFIARLSGGTFEINDDDTIPQKVLNRLLGKEFYKLRYCVGSYNSPEGEKPSFRDYRKIQPVEEGKDKELHQEFLKGLSFIKGYDPNYFEKWRDANDDSTSFEPGNLEEGDGSPI